MDLSNSSPEEKGIGPCKNLINPCMNYSDVKNTQQLYCIVSVISLFVGRFLLIVIYVIFSFFVIILVDHLYCGADWFKSELYIYIFVVVYRNVVKNNHVIYVMLYKFAANLGNDTYTCTLPISCNRLDQMPCKITPEYT